MPPKRDLVRTPLPAKVIQFGGTQGALVVLCEDGTVWQQHGDLFSALKTEYMAPPAAPEK